MHNRGLRKTSILIIILLLPAYLAFAEDTPATTTDTSGTVPSTTSTAPDSSSGSGSTAPLPDSTTTATPPSSSNTESPVPADTVTNPDVPGASCPAIEPKQCDFGNRIDSNGCLTSECKPNPQSPDNPNPLPPPQDTPPKVPDNCKQIIDSSGMERFVCDTQCPEPPPESEMQKCKDNQGVPKFFADSRGCNIFECSYQKSGNFGSGQCPSEEERSRVSEQCKQSGMRAVMRNDFNGCLIVDCVNEGRKDEMQCPPNDVDAKIAEQCRQNGGRVVPGFDPRGCRISLCEYDGSIPGAMQGGPDSERFVKSGECREIPKEAFEKCSNDGGNLVVKRDDRGCPAFSECLMRGNERNLQYEEVSEVPDASVLLSMAFKLENLKIEFDKLSKKTDDIASYYDSTGKTADAERFRKASSMFVGAETRIDEIKSKMKTRVDSMTKEDISEIKHDIKYIREVVMKDILYVMLGGDESERNADSSESGSIEDAKEGAFEPSKNSEGYVNCGTDGFCFNEQLRVCEKAIFYPPSERGGKTVMNIEGLEDGKCVLNAEVLERGTSVAEMTCKFPDYVMGMKGPEELMPYCEGSMADQFKRFGAASRQNNSEENMRFGERPESTMQARSNFVRPAQPIQPVQPITSEQLDPDFPQEIAPIGYLLKQFALI